MRGGGGMTNYAILDIESDAVYGAFSDVTVARVVRDALSAFFDTETRFSLIKYEYID